MPCAKDGKAHSCEWAFLVPGHLTSNSQHLKGWDALCLSVISTSGSLIKLFADECCNYLHELVYFQTGQHEISQPNLASACDEPSRCVAECLVVDMQMMLLLEFRIQMKYCVGMLPDFINEGFVLMHNYSDHGVDL
ncbi:MAG: hypothetical protein VX505_02825 [Chloroflexota bacterium]|nr:hypothetical protein [Chloroflexota bacterium]